MINTILDNLREDLLQCMKKKRGIFFYTARMLMDQINHIDTLEKLLIQLELKPTPLVASYFSFLTNATSVTDFFTRQRQKVIQEIRVRQQLHTEVSTKFHQLKFPPNVQGLAASLQHILANSTNLIHGRACELLTILNDITGTQEIINHIAQLTHMPRSAAVSAGSFDASSWLNKKHAACLDFLRSNSANYNLSQNHRRTNQFLQTLLIIEHDMHTPSPEFEENSAFKSNCTIA